MENISVVGLGKLGLCIAACFADKGFKVIGMDIDLEKIEKINMYCFFENDTKWGIEDHPQVGEKVKGSSGVRFIVFCPGRTSLTNKYFIGTTHNKAAKIIADSVFSNTSPFQINFPVFQYILIRLSRFILDNVYFKYICR